MSQLLNSSINSAAKVEIAQSSSEIIDQLAAFQILSYISRLNSKVACSHIIDNLFHSLSRQLVQKQQIINSLRMLHHSPPKFRTIKFNLLPSTRPLQSYRQWLRIMS